MISAFLTNLRQDVWTSRGDAMVQLHQALSQTIRLSPSRSFEEVAQLRISREAMLRFASLLSNGGAVALGYPVSEIKLRQNKHDRDTSLADDLFEQAKVFAWCLRSERTHMPL